MDHVKITKNISNILNMINFDMSVGFYFSINFSEIAHFATMIWKNNLKKITTLLIL